MVSFFCTAFVRYIPVLSRMTNFGCCQYALGLGGSKIHGELFHPISFHNSYTAPGSSL
jgi:hypothetical protein